MRAPHPAASDLVARFLAYAQAFEQTYQDDDWHRLEPFVAPDVVYRVLGSPGFDCVVEGRGAVFAAIRRFLDGFDRRCVRRVSPGATPPVVEGDRLHVFGSATYRRGDSDELLLEIELVTEFREGLIVCLSDVYPLANRDRTRAWLARHGEGLRLSYL